MVQQIVRSIMKNPANTKSIVFATLGGCAPILGVVVQEKHSFCDAFKKAALDFAKSDKVDSVVIGAQWFSLFYSKDYYYEDNGGFIGHLGKGSVGSEAAYRKLQQTLLDLKLLGKKVYLILSIPIGVELDPHRMFRRDFFGNFSVINKQGIKKKKLLDRYGFIRERLKEVANKSGAEVIDPVEYLCDKSMCYALTQYGEPIYKDECHIRASFSRQNVHFLDKILMVTP